MHANTCEENNETVVHLDSIFYPISCAFQEDCIHAEIEGVSLGSSIHGCLGRLAGVQAEAHPHGNSMLCLQSFPEKSSVSPRANMPTL